MRSTRRVLLHTKLLLEGGARNPRSRLSRRALLHHLVDLLERQALGLRDEEVSEEHTSSASRAPDEENLGTQVALILVNHVGGDVTDDEVPEPVGGGGKSDALGTDGEREDLADDDPGGRTPGGGKEKDVEADENNEDVAGGGGAGSCSTDDGDDKFTDKHADGAPDEKGSAAEALNGPEGDGSGADVDDGGDDTNDEGALWNMGLLEEGRAVVEDEVDTGCNDGLACQI